MKEKKVITIGYYEGYKQSSKEIAEAVSKSLERNKDNFKKVLDDLAVTMFRQVGNVEDMVKELKKQKNQPPLFDDVEENVNKMDVLEKYAKENNIICIDGDAVEIVIIIDNDNDIHTLTKGGNE